MQLPSVKEIKTERKEFRMTFERTEINTLIKETPAQMRRTWVFGKKGNLEGRSKLKELQEGR